MTTLVLQWVTTAFALLFGLLGLLVARAYPGPGIRRDCWVLTGAAFSVLGVLKTGQELWATSAFIAGPGSPRWDEYLRWAPTLNHSRGFLILAFVGLLGVLGWWRRPLAPRSGLMAASVLLVGISTGAVIGWMEGYFVERIHYAMVAVFDGIATGLLAAALLIHLARDTMDRLLWCCLCFYGFHLATGLIAKNAFAWIGVEGAWHPWLIGVGVADVVSAVAISAFGVYALVLTRRGVYIPALLEHPQPMKSAALP